ncbi:MAG: hypothetical protein AB1489_39450 [Acidobacteriota bacterium]
MSKKLVIVVSAIILFIFIGIIVSSSENPTQSSSNQQSTNKPQESEKIFTIKSEIIRVGNRDIASDSARQFTYEKYDMTALTDISETIDNYQQGQVIRVPFKDDIEVEIEYDPLDLKERGIFGGGSEFLITPDRKEGGSKSNPIQGKVRAWKIENNRAIANFPPWVYAPYGDGGTTKLELILETKDGKKFTREWAFQVGKNPEVYEKEFE